MVVTRRFAVVAVGCALVVGLVAGGVGLDGSTAAAPAPAGVRDRALALLRSRAGRYLTPNAFRGLQELAGVGPGRVRGALGVRPARAAQPVPFAAPRPSSAGSSRRFRVNDPPRQDLAAPDQSTQSETRDRGARHERRGRLQRHAAGPSPTDRRRAPRSRGLRIRRTAAIRSRTPGRSRTRGGFINLGDPWLATDRAGNFFYSTLMLGGEAVAAACPDVDRRSDVPSAHRSLLHQRRASTRRTSLPSPWDVTRASLRCDDVYLAWDDFQFDDTTGADGVGFAGGPVDRRRTARGRPRTQTASPRPMAVASVAVHFRRATAGGPRLGCAPRVRRTHRGDGLPRRAALQPVGVHVARRRPDVRAPARSTT